MDRLSSSFIGVFIITIVWFVLSFSDANHAQTLPQVECAMSGISSITVDQRGGRWTSSSDTLNVLVVFVQFPDDRYDMSYPLWPTNPDIGSYPGPTYLKTFIDSTRFQMSSNGNLTHYFRQMSLGQFTLIGKARFVVTPHSRRWYLVNKWQRWQINMEVLQTLDANLDFGQFDNYKFSSEYDIRKQSDGRVDDIFMIYRNIAHDMVSPGSYDSTITVMNFLRFPTSPGSSTGSSAESSLGYARTGSPNNEPIQFTVDGGLRRIYHAHPDVPGYADTLGLGTTSVCAGSADSWGVPPYRVQIHEFAHHWISHGPDYGHNGGGFGAC